MRLISKHTTMTSKEILKADVIDIIFENRNKSYGAYALRKQYDKRMATAIGITISTVALVVLLFQPSGGETMRLTTIHIPDTVTLTALPNDPVEPPPPPPVERPQFAQVQHTNIVIGPDNEATPIATIDDIAVRQISTATVAGDLSPHSISDPDPVIPAGNGSSMVPQESNESRPIQIQPSFPGGMNAWISFLQRHLRVPEELEPGIKVTVLVKFIVGTDGSINNFEVVQSGGSSFDREVIRVLKKMPKWTPAMQNGHPAATSFTQPVSFQVYEQ